MIEELGWDLLLLIILVVPPTISVAYLCCAGALYGRYLGSIDDTRNIQVWPIAARLLQSLDWIAERLPILGGGSRRAGLAIGFVVYIMAWPIMLPLELGTKRLRTWYGNLHTMLA